MTTTHTPPPFTDEQVAALRRIVREEIEAAFARIMAEVEADR